MSLYVKETNDTQSYEVVEAMRDLVAASNQIVTPYFILEADHVFAHSVDEAPAQASEDEEFPERYVVVREAQGVGARVQSISGYDVVPVQVMACLKRDLANNRTHASKWMAAIHNRLKKVINGQTVSLTLNQLVLPFAQEEKPSTPELDPLDETYWYSTALYLAVLAPPAS